MKFMKINYIGLCNILSEKMIVPELLQYDCTPDELSTTIEMLLTDTNSSNKMVTRLQQMALSLSATQADCSIVELIESELNNIVTL